MTKSRTTPDDALQQSEQRYRLLVENLNEGVFQSTLTGTFVHVNAAVVAMAGYESAAELTARPTSCLYADPADRPRLIEMLLRDGEARNVELKSVRKDGTHYWISLTAVLQRDEEGHPAQILGIVSDIAERKRAEQALARIMAAVESTSEAIGISDAHGRHVYQNKALSSLFGYATAEELEAAGGGRAVVKDPAVAAQMFDNIMQGKPWVGELEMVTRGGHVFPAYERADAILDATGNVAGLIGVITDITERKETEKVLHLFKELVQHSSDAIGMSTPDGAHFYQNDAFDRLFGDIGANPPLTVYADEKIGRHVFDTLMRGGRWQGEVEMIGRDRSHLNVFLRAFAIKDDTDRVLALVGAHTDITERTASAKALRESEEKYRNLFNNAEVGMLRTRLDGSETLDFNEQFLRIFGRTREEVLGQPSVMHWADPLERAEMVRLLEAEGHVTGFECRMLNKQGEVRWCVTSLRLYREQGILEGSIMDITERHRAEEALREASKLSQQIIESVNEGIVVYDHDLRYVVFNPFMERLSGKSAAQMIGKHPWDVFPFLSGLRERLTRALAGDAPVQLDFPFELPSGRKGWTSDVSAALRNTAGEIVGVIATVRDITDRKRAESEKDRLASELQQAQKMESIGRLAGGVAHDFNNMLGVILGHADLALLQVGPSDSVHADLEAIRKAAVRSSDLTGQLLAFARKQTVAPRVLNLNETVAATSQMLRRLIGEDINLVLQPDADPWQVKVDPSQVDQILANLCVNARDAIDGPGRITIETGHRTFTEVDCATHAELIPGEYVLLTVRDNGSGMDREVLSHLFEPFFTTKSMGQGTGLGLATVYGIVRQNNGFIDVESEPGAGSTFRIYLPRFVGKAAPAARDTGPGQTPRGHETILLVEDETEILALAARMLARMGYTVIAAATPGEAIRLASEHAGEIHMLMTDVVMPEMNGRDLARNLLSLYPHLKRLFMSGYTADVIAHRGVLDDGVHFIQKPFSFKGLAAKVREALDHEAEDAR